LALSSNHLRRLARYLLVQKELLLLLRSEKEGVLAGAIEAGPL